MLGFLGKQRLKVTSSGALATDDVVNAGVGVQPDINAIAARKDREIEILIWNYHDDDLPFPAAPIDLVVTGLPEGAARGLVENFRIDSNHSNAFTVWKEMGSPARPSDDEFKRLESAGQLQLLSSPAWTAIKEGAVRVQFSLPRQGLSLLRLSW